MENVEPLYSSGVSLRARARALLPDTEAELANRSKNAELLRLVQAYRVYGHLLADLDPLGLQPARYPAAGPSPRRLALPRPPRSRAAS